MEYRILPSWVIFFTFFLASNATAVTLQDGTDIPVRLAENVNGNINMTGETVYFQVTEDVVVDQQTVIRSGTFVKGAVNEAVGRKSLGKGGKLSLVPKSLKTESGDVVQFERNPLSLEGRKRTGATVAHVVMWGPLGLFAKGRAAFIFRETEFDITVDGNYELEPVSVFDSNELPQPLGFVVEFAEYSQKVNYRKGKLGKDFTVYVENSKDYDIKQIEITAVDGFELPKPIKPVEFSVNRKHPGKTLLTFVVQDIIKYAVPEHTEFTFTINERYQTTASLHTEWKLK